VDAGDGVAVGRHVVQLAPDQRASGAGPVDHDHLLLVLGGEHLRLQARGEVGLPARGEGNDVLDRLVGKRERAARARDGGEHCGEARGEASRTMDFHDGSSSELRVILALDCHGHQQSGRTRNTPCAVPPSMPFFCASLKYAPSMTFFGSGSPIGKGASDPSMMRSGAAFFARYSSESASNTQESKYMASK